MIGVGLGIPWRRGASGGGSADPNAESVVFLSHFDGADGATSATDESNSAHALTFNGTAQLDTAQSKFGGSSLLIGGTSGNFVTAADSADWSFGSGAFTVEAWVYQTAGTTGSTSYQGIAGQWNTASQRSWWLLANGASNTLTFFISGDGIGTNTVTGAVIPLNEWVHVAVDRSGNDFRTYLNGSPTKTASTVTLFNSSAVMSIGRDASNAGREWKGWIDDVRITKGVARYATDVGFTPPTAAFPNS